ncbi:hypothetical protein F3J34_30155 [Klebsiella sp. Ap-873]|nr:hypothetical protein [Klebsiella sp. Ap-873]
MAVKDKNEAPKDTETDSFIKFCPICGGTMHKENYLNAEWWFCDDPECGFIEPVK